MRHLLIIVFCLGVGTGTYLPAGAVELVPAATLYNGGRADVCFGDRRVYVASATGLEIFDISDPANPHRSGQVIRTEGASFVVRSGNTLALATASDSLIFYNLPDRDHPVQVSAFGASGRIRVLESHGSHIYFADRAGWKRFQTRLAGPPLLDYVQTEHARIGALAFTGDSMYVVRGDGLTLVYAVNPLPRLIDLYWSRTDIESFTIADGFAYAAARDSGVFVYELDPDTGAREVGRFYTYGAAYQMVAECGMLYVADRQRGLLILDLVDPIHPFLVGQINDPVILRTVRVQGPLAAGAATDGLYLFRVSNPYIPSTVGHMGGQYIVRSLAVDQDFLFAAVDRAGLSVIDISGVSSPVIRTEEIFADQLLGLGRAGKVLAMACGAAGLVLADISDPVHPVEVFRERTIGLAMDVAVDDSLAIVADGSAGFRIFLTDDPPNSRLIGGRKTSFPVTSVARRGNYVYAAGRDLGLEVYDITNAFKPQLTYRLRPKERVYPLTLHERYAYLGIDTIGVLVFDISSPGHPAIVDTVKVTRYPRGIIADGALVCVLDAFEGVMLIDYRTPGAAEVISSIPLAPSANDFLLTADGLYVGGQAYLDAFHVVPPALRGDLNGDGVISMADIVYFVNFIYRDGPIPLRDYSADLNGDGRIDLVDLVRLIRLVFR